MSRTRKLSLIASAVLVVALVSMFVWLAPVHDAIDWIRGLGLAGVAVYLALFIVNNVLALPSTPIFVAAGLMYGVWWGLLLTTVGGIVVELIVMALVRTRARSWLERQAHRHAKLAAIDRALADSPFWVVWLLRLSPAVPFGVLNYVMAPVKMPLRKRLAAHVLGMGPCNLLEVYVGSLLANVGGLSDAAPPGPWKYVVLGVGIAAAIIALVITTVATRRILAQHDTADGYAPSH